MKKSSLYLILIILTIGLGASNLQAQKRIDRQVFGSGGFVNEKTTANWKVSGVVGQLAIEKREGQLNGKNYVFYQGFWGPRDFNTGTGIDEQPEIVRNTNLGNYPNPAINITQFRYTLPGQSLVTLKVFDVSGNLVKELVNTVQEQGDQSVSWDLRSNAGVVISSGSYMYELNVSPAQLIGSQAFTSYTARNIMVVIK